MSKLDPKLMASPRKPDKVVSLERVRDCKCGRKVAMTKSRKGFLYAVNVDEPISTVDMPGPFPWSPPIICVQIDSTRFHSCGGLTIRGR